MAMFYVLVKSLTLFGLQSCVVVIYYYIQIKTTITC